MIFANVFAIESFNDKGAVLSCNFGGAVAAVVGYYVYAVQLLRIFGSIDRAQQTRQDLRLVVSRYDYRELVFNAIIDVREFAPFFDRSSEK